MRIKIIFIIFIEPFQKVWVRSSKPNHFRRRNKGVFGCSEIHTTFGEEESEMGELYALDFDGVICDSCGESSISALKVPLFIPPKTILIFVFLSIVVNSLEC